MILLKSNFKLISIFLEEIRYNKKITVSRLQYKFIMLNSLLILRVFKILIYNIKFIWIKIDNVSFDFLVSWKLDHLGLCFV